MEGKIIDYLVKKYEPTGIILFGSRVSENAPFKSDWDLFVFTNKKEDEVEDYADLKEFEGEAIEVSPESTNVSDDFILQTASHPVEEARILYDKSDGLMEKIIKNTKEAYNKKPNLLNERKKDLYRKILNKFIRKAESRPENLGYVYFGVSQFYIYAIRYWFENRGEWPKSIHNAIPYIESVDIDFSKFLEILVDSNRENEAKIKAMKTIRDLLF